MSGGAVLAASLYALSFTLMGAVCVMDYRGHRAARRQGKGE